ncbi:MAG: SAF domain-containing protein, partial [Actinoallomurus sp.]
MRTLLSRHRRLLAALFASAAAALSLAATHPHTPGVQVLVAARDLPAGTTLTASDVTTRTFPAETVPDGAILAEPDRAGPTPTGTIPSGTAPTGTVPDDTAPTAAVPSDTA